MMDDRCSGRGRSPRSLQLHPTQTEYIRRRFYNRRDEMNPLVLSFHSLRPVRELLAAEPLPQNLLSLKIKVPFNG